MYGDGGGGGGGDGDGDEVVYGLRLFVVAFRSIAGGTMGTTGHVIQYIR